MHVQNRSLGRSTPVYDHADRLLYRAPRERVVELLMRRDVDILGSATRIRAIRFRGPDPALSLAGSHPRRGLGSPHRNESYYNPRGVWHLDRIPESLRERFVAVVEDCLRSKSTYACVETE